jgi:hypothetical protein
MHYELHSMMARGAQIPLRDDPAVRSAGLYSSATVLNHVSGARAWPHCPSATGGHTAGSRTLRPYCC